MNTNKSAARGVEGGHRVCVTVPDVNLLELAEGSMRSSFMLVMIVSLGVELVWMSTFIDVINTTINS